MPLALRLSHVRKVTSLLGEMLEHADHGAALAHGLNGMCRLLGAQVGLIAELSDFSPRGRGAVAWLWDVGWQDAQQRRTAVAPYLGQGCIADPSAGPLLQRASQAQVLRRSDLVSAATWYSSGFFCDARRAAGIDHLLHSIRPLGRERVEGMTFIRPLGDPDFDEEALGLTEVFHQHVVSVWRALRLGGLDTGEPALDTGELALDTGELALDTGELALDMSVLSPRERQVGRLLALGNSEKEAAAALGLSAHTCHQYVKSLYRKLGVHSRAQLVRLALGPPRCAARSFVSRAPPDPSPLPPGNDRKASPPAD